MAPPPATPTPHRFLVSKRSQPRNETPKPAFQSSGAQQFRATPRFSLPSTPRARAGPSSSLTPFRHRGTPRDVVIDSSPPSSPGPDSHDAHDDDDRLRVDDEYEGDRAAGYEQELMVDDDDDDVVVEESSPIRGAESDSEGRSSRNGGRRAKRRRISPSPSGIGIEEPPSLPETGSEPDVEMRDPGLDIESSFFSVPSLSEHELASDEEVPENDIEDVGGEDSPRYQEKQLPKAAHQPTFQKAPRFRPAGIPEGAPRPEPLPDAFSPRRKGAKYIQGGLAAELRDWLVDVEAGIGSGSTTGPGAKRDEEWVARIRVDSLRSADRNARGMTLVLGRQVLDGKSGAGVNGESEEAVEVLGTNTIRLVLAGPGRLSGLGVGNDVRPGVLLGIARPTWEVVLDGLGRWGVACDWVVLR
ncbi:hypothetical protein F4825DRAFT_163293 [Nemania diffusa]|nr:hypothetical protein F4825DRAFT_163293 [Nemania diffusa]